MIAYGLSKFSGAYVHESRVSPRSEHSQSHKLQVNKFQGEQFSSAKFFLFDPYFCLSCARVRKYNALYRLEWPSDLHYSSLGERTSDTLLKFHPEAKRREKRASEGMDDRSRA